MALNLNILPLSTVDNISFQKCLIPKETFPLNARPAQWAKCYLSGFDTKTENFTLTQLFPRADIDHACYLDLNVTKFDFEDERPTTLKNVLLLQKQSIAGKIDVVIHLIPRYFIKNFSLVTKSCLLELVQNMLQKYHITNKCTVKDSYFSNYGVDRLNIEVVGDTDENSCYVVTDDTIVNIKNICLVGNPINSDLLRLDILPFTHARRELDDLMKIVRLQRSNKRYLRMNLNALVVGAVGSGKTALLEQFLKDHCCNVFHIEITNCLKQYPGETETELREIFKAAYNFESKFKTEDPIVILLEEIHLLCPQITKPVDNNSDALANSLRISAQILCLVDELYTLRTSILCLATTSKPDSLNELARRSGRFENEILISGLQEEHRHLILKQLLSRSISNYQVPPHILERMAKQTQGYVIADLTLIVRNIAQAILSKPEESLEMVVIDMIKKSKPISIKGSDVRAYRTCETFEMLGGMFKLKKLLEVSVLASLKHPESFKRFGLCPPKGILLYGPPGCAKTTIAKCLATEANMTFIATSGAEVYSPYVGCAEKFIARIFQTARKNSPCLVFLDEIDSLVGRRSLSGSSGSDDVQVRILSTLLTEMDGVVGLNQENINILVVAATNRPDMIDDALMRPGRFDKLIHVPAPDLLSRRSILDLCAKKMPFGKCVDLDNISVRTDNYSGADLCNLCNEAGMQAFQRDFSCNEIKMDDFESILKTTKSSLTRSQIDWYYQFENKFI